MQVLKICFSLPPGPLPTPPIRPLTSCIRPLFLPVFNFLSDVATDPESKFYTLTQLLECNYSPKTGIPLAVTVDQHPVGMLAILWSHQIPIESGMLGGGHGDQASNRLFRWFWWEPLGHTHGPVSSLGSCIQPGYQHTSLSPSSQGH